MLKVTRRDCESKRYVTGEKIEIDLIFTDRRTYKNSYNPSYLALLTFSRLKARFVDLSFRATLMGYASLGEVGNIRSGEVSTKLKCINHTANLWLGSVKRPIK